MRPSRRAGAVAEQPFSTEAPKARRVVARALATEGQDVSFLVNGRCAGAMGRPELAAHPAKSALNRSEGVALLGEGGLRRWAPVRMHAEQGWLPDEWARVPAEWAALPREQAVVPHERAVLPDEQAVLPRERALLLDEQVVLRLEQAVLPHEQAMLHDEQAPLLHARAPLPHEEAWLPRAFASLPEARGGMPDERAWEPSVFVGPHRWQERYPSLRVGHPYEDLGKRSEEVGEHSKFVREPDSQGEELCPCERTLSLFGPLPYEQGGLPRDCVGMPDVFGQHPSEHGRMPDPFGQEPRLFGRVPYPAPMGPRREGTDAKIERRDA
jgi:hypothetical protein